MQPSGSLGVWEIYLMFTIVVAACEHMTLEPCCWWKFMNVIKRVLKSFYSFVFWGGFLVTLSSNWENCPQSYCQIQLHANENVSFFDSSGPDRNKHCFYIIRAMLAWAVHLSYSCWNKAFYICFVLHLGTINLCPAGGNWNVVCNGWEFKKTLCPLSSLTVWCTGTLG